VLVCKAWADRVEKECREWADEGYEACSEWEEERHKDCCDWWPCSWACDAWVWVSSWVCRGWYWVAKWVCVAWTYVVRTVCVGWGWVTVVGCGFWSILICALKAILDGIRSLFGRSRRRNTTIDHIFVLMLENRSFDHMLGFSGITGRDAVTGAQTSARDLTSGTFSNPDPNDPMNPAEARIPAAFAISAAVKDPGHEFDNILTQLAGPDAELGESGSYPTNLTNSGFVIDYTERASSASRSIMNCYAPRQLPVLNTLAREFSLCDAWHASLPGPTFPNRFFAHAASSGGLDDSPSGLEIGWNTVFDGFRFNNGTVFELLDEACIDWEVVEGDETPATFALAGMSFNAVVRNRFTDFPDFIARLAEGGTAPPYVFIEPHYGNILPGTSEDYTCGTSQHPLDDVTRGEQLIKETYEAIRNSKLWESSVLIVTWDEHGGFYDHVPPGPAIPPGDGVSEAENVHHGFAFDRLGPRVPAVVISPRIPKNTIDHTEYDHASILATIEHNFGLDALTERDAAANDLVHLLSLETPRTDTPATLPAPADSGFTCVGIFDLIKDAVITRAGQEGAAGDDDREWPEQTPDSPPKPNDRTPLRRRLHTRATREADAKAKWLLAAQRKASNPPDLRGAEIVTLLREMSLLRRWDARGRVRAIERFRTRLSQDDVRRYIADVRSMVRTSKRRPTTVPAGLQQHEEDAG
jgi:phospholipase C